MDIDIKICKGDVWYVPSPVGLEKMRVKLVDHNNQKVVFRNLRFECIRSFLFVSEESAFIRHKGWWEFWA